MSKILYKLSFYIAILVLLIGIVMKVLNSSTYVVFHLVKQEVYIQVP